MITLQDWAEIRHLHGAEGMSVRAIAARLGLSRDTVAELSSRMVRRGMRVDRRWTRCSMVSNGGSGRC